MAVSSGAWLWLFPAVYLVHLVDERFYWIGTAEFATYYLGIYFTNTAWWAVNVPSLALFVGATRLVARARWPEWVVISLAIHLGIHGLSRIPTSLWTATIAPGLLSGLLLCVPLSAAALARARGSFSRAAWMKGLVVGLVSFQPWWHFAVLPILPEGPGATGR